MKRPTREEVTVFETPEAFRDWLEGNHGSADSVWVGYYRKGAGGTSMTYPDSVDQALCFGWIDGISYRVDDEVRTIRFTPRRRGSNWSAVNIGKVERLTADGLMAEAGTRAFEARTQSQTARTHGRKAPRRASS